MMTFGFIGLGEAGSTIAKGLQSAGAERLCAFDINTHSARHGALIQQRAEQSGVTLVESSAELARASEILFSTVTSSAALDAANQTAPFLQAHHVYADLNSVSPALKREIAGVIDRA